MFYPTANLGVGIDGYLFSGSNTNGVISDYALMDINGNIMDITEPIFLDLMYLTDGYLFKLNKKVLKILKQEQKNLITEFECVHGYNKGTNLRVFGDKTSKIRIRESDNKLDKFSYYTIDNPEIDSSLYDFILYEGSGKTSYYKCKESYTTEETFEWL